MSEQNALRFAEVKRMLQTGHQLMGDTPSKTINRLFRKTILYKFPRKGRCLPWLTSENCNVRLEHWPMERLLSLKRDRTIVRPLITELPVVVVMFRGCKALIDGHSRIAWWGRQKKRTNKRPVWVLRVKS